MAAFVEPLLVKSVTLLGDGQRVEVTAIAPGNVLTDETANVLTDEDGNILENDG